MLISYSSTAIEEAIYNRKPVGLFGGSDRYRHLIGSSTLPSKKYRSTVYYLQNNNLSEMLNAILDAHNTPLNDKELELYTWPFTIPGRTEFISKILN